MIDTVDAFLLCHGAMDNIRQNVHHTGTAEITCWITNSQKARRVWTKRNNNYRIQQKTLIDIILFRMSLFNIFCVLNQDSSSCAHGLSPCRNVLGKLKFIEETFCVILVFHVDPPKRVPHIKLNINFKDTSPVTTIHRQLSMFARQFLSDHRWYANSLQEH